MAKMINPNSKVHIEKITNESFDDIISHSNFERKYFTIENNDTIYKKFKSELSIECLPYLGPCVDFGLGDICLEESKNNFKFYIIDRETKCQYKEFDKVEDAIQRLISYYREFELVDNPDKMEKILYQTLGLSKQENTIISKEHIKILKL